MHIVALLGVFSQAFCWNVYDRALAHSAVAARPPYVSYSERTSIFVDGETLERTNAHIDYRDDGVARIADERFDYIPFVTRTLDPGPPEIGPYGASRELWMPAAPDIKTIAAVRARGNVTCAVRGTEILRGRQTYHLAFTGAYAGRPHLDDLWVDAASADVLKVALTAPAPIAEGLNDPASFAHYEVELRAHGSYLLVDTVTWLYRQRAYSQQMQYSGEYSFADYSFPQSLPPSYFALEK